MKDLYVKAKTTTSIGQEAMKQKEEQIAAIELKIPHDRIDRCENDKGEEVVRLNLPCIFTSVPLGDVHTSLKNCLPEMVANTLLDEFETAIYKATVMEALKKLIV